MPPPNRRIPRYPIPFEPGAEPGLIAAWLPDRGFAEFGSVDVWPDVSSFGRNATQGTALNQPVVSEDGYLPKHPMVVFDGVHDFLDVANWTTTEPASYTFYTVLNQVDDGSQQFIFSAWDSTSGTGGATEQLILTARTVGGQVAIWDGDREFKDLGAIQAGRQVLTWCLNENDGVVEVYRDNALIGTDAYTAPNGWDTVRIGADATDSGTSNYNGGCYIFAYAGVHDAATRARVITALQRLSPITDLMFTGVLVGTFQLAAFPSASDPAPALYDSNVLTHDGASFLAATTDNGFTPPGIGQLPMGIAVNLQARKGTVCMIGQTELNGGMAQNTVGSTNYNATLARVSAAGVTPSVAFISCGELDIINTTAPATFEADLSAVVVDIETNWPGITVIILQLQIDGGASWDAADSLPYRTAQQTVADAGANRLIITETDHLNNLRPDGVVPNTIGRDIIASYFAALVP